MGTETAPKTLEIINQLTQLLAQEDFVMLVTMKALHHTSAVIFVQWDIDQFMHLVAILIQNI
jgi:hypothetical protein